VKRRWTIIILATIAVVAGGMAWLCWPRALPEEECSEVYRQWADVDGVEATFLRGYRVNDSVTVDATLLQATDSAGWDSLAVFYGFSLSLHLDAEQFGTTSKSLVFVNSIESDSSYVGVASVHDKYVCLFHYSNNTEKRFLTDVIIDKIIESISTNQIFLEYEKNN